ncbi:MAG: ABC transporter ATP-binding protein [Lautropia sp.]
MSHRAMTPSAARAGAALLAADRLTIGYGNHPIARDVSLAVGPGEVMCLLGPNGCGKTTLLRTLLGLLPPLAGTVRCGGTELAALSRRAAARRLAYVPQAHAPVFRYSVAEVVLMGRAAHLGWLASPGSADRAIALESLERLGIADLAGDDYARLSGGQRQLVLIARALAARAAVLIMDEPTAGLDFGNRLRVLEQIGRLAAGGLAVLLSTHDPDEALAIGTAAALLRDGALLAQGPVAEVIDTARLGALYGIPIDVVRLPDGRRACVPAAASPGRVLP